MLKNTIKYLLGLIAIFALKGCENYTKSYELLRFPQINIDLGERQFATGEYDISYLGTVVAFPDSLSTESDQFHRYVINAFLSEDENERLEITIDVSDREIPIGTFNDAYQGKGILNNVSLILRDRENPSNNAYTSFKLVEEALPRVFVVENKNEEESLIRGEFEARVVERITNDVFTIEGKFNDINYEEE